jgi:A/G-specific adenine glycosylase
VEALADEDEESVLKAWEGLGYYSRARNLHSSARQVRERFDGVLPQDFQSLKELPGIGEYSAGAIASIAYGEVVPAVDGNVRRVLSRLFDLEDPTAANLRKRAAELVDPERPGDWNQALMELGATVCTPRAPRCTACPLVGDCRSMAAGTQESRPLPKRRPKPPTISYSVVVAVNQEGELLMVRRPPDGLLGGLWEFPSVEGGEEDPASTDGTRRVSEASGAPPGNPLDRRCRVHFEELGVELPASASHSSVLPKVRHAFTHFKAVYCPTVVVGVKSRGDDATGPSRIALDDDAVRWVAPREVEHLPLPVAQRRIFELAMAARGWAEAPCYEPAPPNGSNPL